MIHRRGGLLHVHCHGPMQAIIEQLAELGSDCLHPVEAPPMGDLPLAEAKRRVGRDVCLEGNIQMDDLYRMETPELIAVVEQAMRDGMPGGGFMLAPTASPYAPVLSCRARDNYLAMIETGVRLGAYG
jgi:uroporphyrinogen-III decarboxylase